MAAESNKSDRQTVADPEEFNQQRRLRSVNESREQVLQWLREINAAELSGNFEEVDAATTLYGAVTAFLLDIEQAIWRHGEDVYFTRELGNIRISPPSEYYIPESGQSVSLDDQSVRVIQSSGPNPYTMTVTGLLTTPETGVGYLDLPPTLRERWEIPAKIKHEGQVTVQGVNSSYVPRRVSEQAFRLGSEFFAEAGMDFEFDQGEQDAEFEYTDLLENGNDGDSGGSLS